MKTIHIVSDLHLEFGNITLPGGDILIIAGDVMEAKNYFSAFHQTRLLDAIPTNEFLKFFEIECAKYKTVLYVLGNHEFYNHDIDVVCDRLKMMLPENVIILNRDIFNIDEYLFVGATLWTDCNKDDWFTKNALKRCMADFYCVKYKDKTFLPEDSIEFHKRDLDFIKTIVELNRNRNVIVITHHSPSYKSCHEKYKGQLLNGGFHSELSDFILNNENIKYWIHGHTHDPFCYDIGNCKIICNPRGYAGYEKTAKNYKPFVLE